ncbi:MAG TPA: hypothetical protein VNO82_22710 [Solirubrobacteraceae bacterium]|nr:hypothetical protein [Solirubrobacteraceae bacterium]
MAAWPGEDIERRASDIADAADQLLKQPAGWRHRRVETLTMLSHEQVRRHVSVDFTVPVELRERLRLSDADEFAVPLAFLTKRPLVHFDLRNEEGHSIPLLTAEQNTMIGRELLYQSLVADLETVEADDVAVVGDAGQLIEAVLADLDATGAVERLERRHGLEPLGEFRWAIEILSRSFILWAVVRGLERRRVFKFAYDEPYSLRPGFAYAYDAAGCTEAWSYHLEVAVPTDLKARTTQLWDAGTGVELVSGARDSDRPALYFVADPVRPPTQPEVVVDYGAERSRFIAPAAIVATVIALLVALPLLFADLAALSGSAGPAIGIVLSTSAVFSALVLRTDEHPLLRRLLVRYRLCLAASTLVALFAGAALGFQAEKWVIELTWAIAAVVSVLTAAILVVAVARSPSPHSRPAPR